MFPVVITGRVGCSGLGTKVTGKYQSVQAGEIAPKCLHTNSPPLVLYKSSSLTHEILSPATHN